METKRILVLCGGRFAFPSIQILGIENFLCGVGVGKGEKNVLSILEQENANNGLPYHSFPDKESLTNLRTWIDELQPDYVFSISFPFLLSKEVLSYGEDKFINFHPGPLPKYRGPMPLFEVIRYQEKETAITVHFMNENFDEGDIILSEKLPVSTTETYGELATKLSERTAMVVQNFAQMLQFASVIPRTKQEKREARYFENPEASDTFIQWNRMPADQIVSLVRACNPWNQGADTILLGMNIKIITATLSDEQHISSPGNILYLTEEGALAISCVDHKVIHVQIIAGDFGILTAKQFIATKSLVNNTFN